MCVCVCMCTICVMFVFYRYCLIYEFRLTRLPHAVSVMWMEKYCLPNQFSFSHYMLCIATDAKRQRNQKIHISLDTLYKLAHVFDLMKKKETKKKCLLKIGTPNRWACKHRKMAITISYWISCLLFFCRRRKIMIKILADKITNNTNTKKNETKLSHKTIRAILCICLCSRFIFCCYT